MTFWTIYCCWWLYTFIFILIWSSSFIFWLHISTAIVRKQFIVHISERIILLLYSQSILGAKLEIILILSTWNDILSPILALEWSVDVKTSHPIRFCHFFMQQEYQMRVLKVWIPSVISIGCKFYPQ